jgi:hypothetical protein
MGFPNPLDKQSAPHRLRIIQSRSAELSVSIRLIPHQVADLNAVVSVRVA